MTKKRYLISIASILTLAACSGNGGSADTSSGGDSGQTASDSPVELEFWHGHTGPDGQVMDQLITQYTTENENVKINVQQLAWDDLFTKAQLGANSNSGPDIVTLPADRLSMYRDSLILPLDELDGEITTDAADFDETLWEATIRDETQYGLPLDTNLYLLYYRPDLVEEAGLDPLPKDRPLTQEEFETYAEAMTSASLHGFAFKQVAQHSWWDLYSVFIQAGGKLYNEDKTESLFDSPETRAAIEYMLSLRDEKGVTPTSNLDWTTAFSMFNDGKVAMLLHGSWLIPGLEDSDTPYDTAMVPAFLDEEYGVFANAHIIAATTTDPAKEAAVVDFMNWITSESSQLEWGTGSGNVPAHLSARSTYAEDDLFVPLATTAEMMNDQLFMSPYTENDETLIYRDIVPNLEGLYAGTLDIDTVIAEIDAAVERAIK